MLTCPNYCTATQVICHFIALRNNIQKDIHFFSAVNRLTRKCSHTHCADKFIAITKVSCRGNPIKGILVFKHKQQDVTLHSGIYYYKRCTCFRWFLRPSSGAQNCIDNIGHFSSCFCFLPLSWVSCGSSTHHQELKTVYTASGIFQAVYPYRCRG